MATVISQFSEGHFGGGPPLGSEISASIGGTAVAGDWLEVTTSGIDGDGFQAPVVTDDVSGSTGWTKVADYDNAANTGNPFRTTSWTKLAVGGETTVTATWPGSTNKTMTGFWASAPTQPNLYVIAQGLASFDGSHEIFATSPGDILTDAETYVGAAAGGRAGLSDAEFTSPPSPPTEGGSSFVLSASCWTVAHYNDDEGSNNTGQTLQYQVAPGQEVYVVWFGFDSGEPEEALVEPAGGILLAGTVDLTVDGGTALVEPAGGVLIGGSVDLEASGGDLNVSPSGGFFGGRVSVFAPSPFPSPVRIPEDRLGCGVYQCFAFTRGLGEIVTMLPFTTVEWERVLDDTSTSTLTIDGVSNPRALARCCAALSELNPAEHELAIYRNGWRVWSGPITDMTFPAEQCVIQASDLSWWLGQRTIHENINSVQQDLVDILVAYVQDAMAVENSAGLAATVLALSGQLADRLVAQADHQLAADVIGELARSGVDWTTLDRKMLVGPLQPQPAPFPGATPYPTLIDANFRVQPTILVSASQQANCWFVNGPPNGAGDLIFGEYGPHFPATDDHVETPAAPTYAASEAQFGRLEKVVTESRILDQPGIDFNAQTRYELLRNAVVSISDGSLLPSTPIPMEKLLAGSIVNVHLSNVCRIIAEPYRIKGVKVVGANDGSESVDVQWQPLGTGETL